MRTYLNGSIPDKIKIVSGLPQEFSWAWNNYTVNNNYKTKNPKLTAHRAFVCDAKENAHYKSALRQATDLSFVLVPNQKNFDKKAFKPDVLVMDNAGLDDVRVVGVEGYANKTSYCVSFLKDKYCFEIESDALMDAITIGGVEGTGHLKGTYVFARVSGKMKLVRVGSDFHQACVEANERKKTESIDKFELVPGKVYQTKTGATSLFLGFVNTYNLTLNMSEAQQKLTTAANTWSPTLEGIPPNWDTGIYVKGIFWKMATLWYDVWNPQPEVFEKLVKQLYDPTSYEARRIDIRKAHSFIEEMPNTPCVDIDIQAIFESCRQTASKAIQEVEGRQVSAMKSLSAVKGGGRVNHNHSIPECFSKEIHRHPLPPGLSWDQAQQQALDFNKQHQDELYNMTRFFKTLSFEVDKLCYATKANMIVYGMPPVINPELQKIMTKYNGPASS